MKLWRHLTFFLFFFGLSFGAVHSSLLVDLPGSTLGWSVNQTYLPSNTLLSDTDGNRFPYTYLPTLDSSAAPIGDLVTSNLNFTQIPTNDGRAHIRFQSALRLESRIIDKFFLLFVQYRDEDYNRHYLLIASDGNANAEALIYEPANSPTGQARQIASFGDGSPDPSASMWTQPLIELGTSEVILSTRNQYSGAATEYARLPLTGITPVKEWTGYAFSSLRTDNAFGYQSDSVTFGYNATTNMPYAKVVLPETDTQGNVYLDAPNLGTITTHSQLDSALTWTPFGLNDGNMIMRLNARIQRETPEHDQYWVGYFKVRTVTGAEKTIALVSDGDTRNEFFLYEPGKELPRLLDRTGSIDTPYPSNPSFIPQIELLSHEIVVGTHTNQWSNPRVNEKARFSLSAEVGEIQEWLSYSMSSLRTNHAFGYRSIEVHPFPLPTLADFSGPNYVRTIRPPANPKHDEFGRYTTDLAQWLPLPSTIGNFGRLVFDATINPQDSALGGLVTPDTVTVTSRAPHHSFFAIKYRDQFEEHEVYIKHDGKNGARFYSIDTTSTDKHSFSTHGTMTPNEELVNTSPYHCEVSLEPDRIRLMNEFGEFAMIDLTRGSWTGEAYVKGSRKVEEYTHIQFYSLTDDDNPDRFMQIRNFTAEPYASIDTSHTIVGQSANPADKTKWPAELSIDDSLKNILSGSLSYIGADTEDPIIAPHIQIHFTNDTPQSRHINYYHEYGAATPRYTIDISKDPSSPLSSGEFSGPFLVRLLKQADDEIARSTNPDPYALATTVREVQLTGSDAAIITQIFRRETTPFTVSFQQRGTTNQFVLEIAGIAPITLEDTAASGEHLSMTKVGLGMREEPVPNRSPLPARSSQMLSFGTPTITTEEVDHRVVVGYSNHTAYKDVHQFTNSSTLTGTLAYVGSDAGIPTAHFFLSSDTVNPDGRYDDLYGLIIQFRTETNEVQFQLLKYNEGETRVLSRSPLHNEIRSVDLAGSSPLAKIVQGTPQPFTLRYQHTDGTSFISFICGESEEVYYEAFDQSDAYPDVAQIGFGVWENESIGATDPALFEFDELEISDTFEIPDRANRMRLGFQPSGQMPIWRKHLELPAGNMFSVEGTAQYLNSSHDDPTIGLQFGEIGGKNNNLALYLKLATNSIEIRKQTAEGFPIVLSAPIPFSGAGAHPLRLISNGTPQPFSVSVNHDIISFECGSEANTVGWSGPIPSDGSVMTAMTHFNATAWDNTSVGARSPEMAEVIITGIDATPPTTEWQRVMNGAPSGWIPLPHRHVSLESEVALGIDNEAILEFDKGTHHYRLYFGGSDNYMYEITQYTPANNQEYRLSYGSVSPRRKTDSNLPTYNLKVKIIDSQLSAFIDGEQIFVIGFPPSGATLTDEPITQARWRHTTNTGVYFAGTTTVAEEQSLVDQFMIAANGLITQAYGVANTSEDHAWLMVMRDPNRVKYELSFDDVKLGLSAEEIKPLEAKVYEVVEAVLKNLGTFISDQFTITGTMTANWQAPNRFNFIQAGQNHVQFEQGPSLNGFDENELNVSFAHGGISQLGDDRETQYDRIDLTPAHPASEWHQTRGSQATTALPFWLTYDHGVVALGFNTPVGTDPIWQYVGSHLPNNFTKFYLPQPDRDYVPGFIIDPTTFTITNTHPTGRTYTNSIGDTTQVDPIVQRRTHSRDLSVLTQHPLVVRNEHPPDANLLTDDGVKLSFEITQTVGHQFELKALAADQTVFHLTVREDGSATFIDHDNDDTISEAPAGTVSHVAGGTTRYWIAWENGRVVLGQESTPLFICSSRMGPPATTITHFALIGSDGYAKTFDNLTQAEFGKSEMNALLYTKGMYPDPVNDGKYLVYDTRASNGVVVPAYSSSTNWKYGWPTVPIEDGYRTTFTVDLYNPLTQIPTAYIMLTSERRNLEGIRIQLGDNISNNTRQVIGWSSATGYFFNQSGSGPDFPSEINGTYTVQLLTTTNELVITKQGFDGEFRMALPDAYPASSMKYVTFGSGHEPVRITPPPTEVNSAWEYYYYLYHANQLITVIPSLTFSEKAALLRDDAFMESSTHRLRYTATVNAIGANTDQIAAIDAKNDEIRDALFDALIIPTNDNSFVVSGTMETSVPSQATYTAQFIINDEYDLKLILDTATTEATVSLSKADSALSTKTITAADLPLLSTLIPAVTAGIPLPLELTYHASSFTIDSTAYELGSFILAAGTPLTPLFSFVEETPATPLNIVKLGLIDTATVYNSFSTTPYSRGSNLNDTLMRFTTLEQRRTELQDVNHRPNIDTLIEPSLTSWVNALPLLEQIQTDLATHTMIDQIPEAAQRQQAIDEMIEARRAYLRLLAAQGMATVMNDVAVFIESVDFAGTLSSLPSTRSLDSSLLTNKNKLEHAALTALPASDDPSLLLDDGATLSPYGVAIAAVRAAMQTYSITETNTSDILDAAHAHALKMYEIREAWITALNALVEFMGTVETTRDTITTTSDLDTLNEMTLPRFEDVREAIESHPSFPTPAVPALNLLVDQITSAMTRLDIALNNNTAVDADGNPVLTDTAYIATMAAHVVWGMVYLRKAAHITPNITAKLVTAEQKIDVLTAATTQQEVDAVLPLTFSAEQSVIELYEFFDYSPYLSSGTLPVPGLDPIIAPLMTPMAALNISLAEQPDNNPSETLYVLQQAAERVENARRSLSHDFADEALRQFKINAATTIAALLQTYAVENLGAVIGDQDLDLSDSTAITSTLHTHLGMTALLDTYTLTDAQRSEVVQIYDKVRGTLSGQQGLLGQLTTLHNLTIPPSTVIDTINGMNVPELEAAKVEDSHADFIRTQLAISDSEEYITSLLASYKTITPPQPLSLIPADGQTLISTAAHTAHTQHDSAIDDTEAALQRIIDDRYAELQRLRDESYTTLQETLAAHKEAITQFTLQTQLAGYNANDSGATGLDQFIREKFDAVVATTRAAFSDNGDDHTLIEERITELNTHIAYWMRLLVIIEQVNLLLGDGIGSGNEILERLDSALTREEILGLDRTAFDEKVTYTIGLINDGAATPPLTTEHITQYTTLVTNEVSRVNRAIANALLAEYIEEVTALIAAAVPDDNFTQIAEMIEAEIRTEEAELDELLAEPDGGLTILRRQLEDLGAYATDATDHPIDVQIEQPLRTAFHARRMQRADQSFALLEQLRDEIIAHITKLLASSDLPLTRLSELLDANDGPEQRRINELTPRAETTEQLFSYVKEPERSTVYLDSRVDTIETFVEHEIRNAHHALLIAEATRLFGVLQAEADNLVILINEQQSSATLSVLWSERFPLFENTVAASRAAFQAARAQIGDALTPEQDDLLNSTHIDPIRQNVIDVYTARLALLRAQEIARGYVIELHEHINDIIQTILDDPYFDDQAVKQALYNQVTDVHDQNASIIARADALLPELDRVLLSELKQQVIDDITRLRDALRRNIFDLQPPPALTKTGDRFPSIVFAPWNVASNYSTTHAGFQARFYVKTEGARGFGIGIRYFSTDGEETYYSIARGEDNNTNTTVQRRTEDVAGPQPYVFGDPDAANNMGITDDGFVFYQLEQVNNTLHLLRYQPSNTEYPFQTLFFVTDPAFSRDMTRPMTVSFRKIAEQGEYVEVRNFDIQPLDEETRPSNQTIATLPTEATIIHKVNQPTSSTTSTLQAVPATTIPQTLFDTTIVSNLSLGYSGDNPHGLQWVNDRLLTPNNGALTGTLQLVLTEYTPADATVIFTLANNSTDLSGNSFTSRYRLQLGLISQRFQLFKEFVSDDGTLASERLHSHDIIVDAPSHPITALLNGSEVAFTISCLPRAAGTVFRLSLQAPGEPQISWDTAADESFSDVTRFGITLWDVPSTRTITMGRCATLSIPNGMQQHVAAVLAHIANRITQASTADNLSSHTSENPKGMPYPLTNGDLSYLETVLSGQDNAVTILEGVIEQQEILATAIQERTTFLVTHADDAFAALTAEKDRLLALIPAATNVALYDEEDNATGLPAADALALHEERATNALTAVNRQSESAYNVASHVSEFTQARESKVAALENEAEQQFVTMVQEKDRRIAQAQAALVLTDLPSLITDDEATALRTAFRNAGITDDARIGDEDSELIRMQDAVADAISQAREKMQKVIALEGNVISIPSGASTEKITMASTRYQLRTGQEKPARKVVTAVNGTTGISYHFADAAGNTYSIRIDRDGIYAKTNDEPFPARPFNTSINFAGHPTTQNVRDAVYQIVMCPVEEAISATERRLHVTFTIEQHLVFGNRTRVRTARRSFTVTPTDGTPTSQYLPQHYQLAAPSTDTVDTHRLTAEPLNNVPEPEQQANAVTVSESGIIQPTSQNSRMYSTPDLRKQTTRGLRL